MAQRYITDLLNQDVKPMIGGTADSETNYSNAFLAECANMAVVWMQNMCDKYAPDYFMTRVSTGTSFVTIASILDYTEAQIVGVTAGTIRNILSLAGVQNGATAPTLQFRRTTVQELLQIRSDFWQDLAYPDRYFFAWDPDAKLLRLSHSTVTPGTTITAGNVLQIRYSYRHATITAAMLASGNTTLLDMNEDAYPIFVLRTALYALARQEQFLPRAQHLLVQLAAESVPGRSMPISQTTFFKALEGQVVGQADAKAWPGRVA